MSIDPKNIEGRLAELGITLAQPAAPVAAYVPAVEAGGLLHISGQISVDENGELIKGRLAQPNRLRLLPNFLPARRPKRIDLDVLFAARLNQSCSSENLALRFDVR